MPVPPASAVEQLEQLEAATCCSRRGKRGPVTSMGGRGPCGLGLPSRGPLPSRSVSIYPCCLYLRSLSMEIYSVSEGEESLRLSNQLFRANSNTNHARRRPVHGPGGRRGITRGAGAGIHLRAEQARHPASA